MMGFKENVPNMSNSKFSFLSLLQSSETNQGMQELTLLLKLSYLEKQKREISYIAV